MVIALTYPAPKSEAVLEGGPASRFRIEGGDNGRKTKAWSLMIFLITSSHFSISSSLSLSPWLFISFVSQPFPALSRSSHLSPKMAAG